MAKGIEGLYEKARKGEELDHVDGLIALFGGEIDTGAQAKFISVTSGMSDLQIGGLIVLGAIVLIVWMMSRSGAYNTR